MIYRIIILLTLLNISYAKSQLFPSYPLHINDRWEININEYLKVNKGNLSKVIKDTISTDSLRYFVIMHSDTNLGEIRYERYDSGKVFRLNIYTRKEELWFDLTKNIGDSVYVVQSSDTNKIYLIDTLTEYILGTSRKCWWFNIRRNMTQYVDEIEISDGIGIVQYIKFNPLIWSEVSLSVVGAFINGKLIRTSYPYIYLPFQPGNWWKFDDDPGIISVIQDTIMSNGKTYALILWGSEIKYFRQDSNFVFSYNNITQQEEIEMDMSSPAGQIWDLKYSRYLVLFYSGGIKTQKVFSMDKETYSYGSYLPDVADAWVSYAYADSFGIINIGRMVSTELVEAQVNGRHYTPTSIAEHPINVPTNYSLGQNYPNPFNSTTIINYSIPSRSFVTLRIYDFLGRYISTLVNIEKSPGNYKVEWNAEYCSSGLYFCRLQSGTFTATQKILLLK